MENHEEFDDKILETAVVAALRCVGSDILVCSLHMSGLCFQEQYQMFLFDTNYFLERIVLPGGLADYISEFLVQFYYMPVLGGTIIALLLMSIQAISWGLMKQYGMKAVFPGYLLSFVPSIVLWCAMGDQNLLLSFVVALSGALLMGWIHNRFHNRLVKVVFELVSTALVYWFLGPVVFLYAALMIGDTLMKGSRMDTFFPVWVILPVC